MSKCSMSIVGDLWPLLSHLICNSRMIRLMMCMAIHKTNDQLINSVSVWKGFALPNHSLLWRYKMDFTTYLMLFLFTENNVF